MEIGYCRVSTEEQNLDMQRDAMERAGIVKIFTDQASGKSLSNRPGLDMALAVLRPGDTLVVWKLDRLARRLVILADLAETFKAKGIGLRSLTEPFDTTTAIGLVLFQLMGVFAEFERNVLVERTVAGLEAARKRGSMIGRKKELSEAQAERMLEEIRSTTWPLEKIARGYGISKTALYNYCPGGRAGLLGRDLAAKELAEIKG